MQAELIQPASPSGFREKLPSFAADNSSASFIDILQQAEDTGLGGEPKFTGGVSNPPVREKLAEKTLLSCCDSMAAVPVPVLVPTMLDPTAAPAATDGVSPSTSIVGTASESSPPDPSAVDSLSGKGRDAEQSFSQVAVVQADSENSTGVAGLLANDASSLTFPDVSSLIPAAKADSQPQESASSGEVMLAPIPPLAVATVKDTVGGPPPPTAAPANFAATDLAANDRKAGSLESDDKMASAVSQRARLDPVSGVKAASLDRGVAPVNGHAAAAEVPVISRGVSPPISPTLNVVKLETKREPSSPDVKRNTPRENPTGQPAATNAIPQSATPVDTTAEGRLQPAAGARLLVEDAASPTDGMGRVSAPSKGSGAKASDSGEPGSTAEGPSLQAQTSPLPTGTGETTKREPAANPPEAPPTLEGGAATAGARSGLVQTAQIVDRAGHTEVHVELRTQAFGSVAVHTALRDSQLGLALSSERGDLRGFLAEAPTLQALLRQHDVQWQNVRFLDPPGQPDASFSGQRNTQGRASPQSKVVEPALAGENEDEPSPAKEMQVVSISKLNVHA